MTKAKSENWPRVELGTITTKIGSGATPRGGKKSYKGSGISLIRSLNVYDFEFSYDDLAFIDDQQAQKLSNVEVQPRDILLNITGASVARCCMVPDDVLPAHVNQHVSIVRVNPEVAYPRYVLYCLNSSYYKHHLHTLAQGGATRQALTQDTIRHFEIALSPLPTQRKIAAILSVYDGLIENNTRRIEILEEMARLIYREWLVHFRFPGHEEVRMVDSPLGRIPEGWEVRKVSEVVDIYRGRSYRSADLVQGGLPFLNLKCIERDGGFRHDGLKRYGGRYKDTQEARPGDIIMAVTDMTQERRIIARAARVPDIGEGMFVFSMDLVKLVPREDVPSNYLYGMLRFSRFSDEVKQYASGANVLHLRPAHIEQFEFPLPPGYLTERYAALASIAYDQCDALLKKNQLLRRARDLLLPRLISAEIDVSELDIDTGTLGDTHTG